jgi:hypothetical protein
VAGWPIGPADAAATKLLSELEERIAQTPSSDERGGEARRGTYGDLRVATGLTPISFQSVARRAGVSRQWLYTQPGLRQQIEALRDRGPVRTDSVPARQRASEASLRQRLQSLRDENQRLREENHSLKTELALAYGQQRDARSR